MNIFVPMQVMVNLIMNHKTVGLPEFVTDKSSFIGTSQPFLAQLRFEARNILSTSFELASNFGQARDEMR